MNELKPSWLSDHLEQIDRIASVQDITNLIKQIDALKVALDAVDQFHAQAVKYAQLEASALIRAVEIGGEYSVPARHRKTAVWLYSLSAPEREKYIAMCSEGFTIDNIYKREVGTANELKERIDAIKHERGKIFEIVKAEGIVDISCFAEGTREKLKKHDAFMAEDIVDGVRNRLRQIGAVGVGSNTGIYVMPNSDNSSAVKNAILTRYKSVMDDMENIIHIARAAKIKMSWKDFGVDVYTADRSGHGFLVSFIVGLAQAGLIEDYEDFFVKVGESDFAADIAFAVKHGNIGKREFIKLSYQREFGEAAETRA